MYPQKRIKREDPSTERSAPTTSSPEREVSDADSESRGNDSQSPYAPKIRPMTTQEPCSVAEMWALTKQLQNQFNQFIEMNKTTSEAMGGLEKRVDDLERERASVDTPDMPSREYPLQPTVVPLAEDTSTTPQYRPVITGAILVKIAGQAVYVPTAKASELQFMDW